jgi:hypothetical protein
VNLPSAQELDERNLGFQDFRISSEQTPVYNAWLNLRNHTQGAQHGQDQQPQRQPHTRLLQPHTRLLHLHTRGRLLHPAEATAAEEIAGVLQIALPSPLPSPALAAHDVPAAVTEGGRVVLGVCSDPLVVHTLSTLEHSLQPDGRGLCEGLSEQGFAFQVIGATAGTRADGTPRCPSIAVVGGGPAGLLYGAFALSRYVQMSEHRNASGLWWTAASFNRRDEPTTTLRLLNHWSHFRGFVQDSWMPRPNGGRGDSLYSWAELKQAAAGNATSVQRVADFARLLASVGINGVAPCDVNWDERNNFLEHLPEVKVLGDVY